MSSTRYRGRRAETGPEQEDTRPTSVTTLPFGKIAGLIAGVVLIWFILSERRESVDILVVGAPIWTGTRDSKGNVSCIDFTTSPYRG